MPSSPCLSAMQFTNFILSQLPVYQDEILRDIRPTDNLAAHVSKGSWAAFSGVEQTQDRFRNVKANTAKAWEAVTDTTCADAPCDPTENEICWGYDRLTYGQERQSWKSQMICFDQEISATKAVEHFMQIISDILRPATSEIASAWVRRKALALAGRKLLANGTMSTFTGTWSTTGNEEIFYTPSAFPTSKLTPEMIKRQIPYLRDVGYFGKWTNDPFFGGYDNFAELITDDDTAWELDKIAANTRVSDLWRFQMWSAAHEYYKYGMGGQIGNYMVHVDPNSLRFNKNGARLQYVPKYINEAATVGIGSTPNPDYYNAQYQISFIWHRFAMEHLVQDLTSINPMMPFLVRGLNGQWNFAMDNLGQDCEGNAIANYRRNKGFFWADFRYGMRPRYTEFLTAILHLREPQVIYEVAPCAADPGYPAQTYNSACDGCEGTYTWFDVPTNEGGTYELAANTVTCSDEPIGHAAVTGATLALFATALNANGQLGALGTWSADGENLIITGATCEPILPFVTT